MIPKLKQFAQGYLIGHRLQADTQFLELESIQWGTLTGGHVCWMFLLGLTAPGVNSHGMKRNTSAITIALYHHAPKSREELIAQDWMVQGSPDRNLMIEVMVSLVSEMLQLQKAREYKIRVKVPSNLI